MSFDIMFTRLGFEERMLNRLVTNALKALPGKLDIQRHSPSILYLCVLSGPVFRPKFIHELVCFMIQHYICVFCYLTGEIPVS